jgi:hypothetical protein
MAKPKKPNFLLPFLKKAEDKKNPAKAAPKGKPAPKKGKK